MPIGPTAVRPWGVVRWCSAREVGGGRRQVCRSRASQPTTTSTAHVQLRPVVASHPSAVDTGQPLLPASHGHFHTHIFDGRVIAHPAAKPEKVPLLLHTDWLKSRPSCCFDAGLKTQRCMVYPSLNHEYTQKHCTNNSPKTTLWKIPAPYLQLIQTSTTQIYCVRTWKKNPPT